jgi:hypothetical protein
VNSWDAIDWAIYFATSFALGYGMGVLDRRRRARLESKPRTANINPTAMQSHRRDNFN